MNNQLSPLDLFRSKRAKDAGKGFLAIQIYKSCSSQQPEAWRWDYLKSSSISRGDFYGAANSVLSTGSMPSIVLESVNSKMNEIGVLSVHSVPAPLNVVIRRFHDVMCIIRTTAMPILSRGSWCLYLVPLCWGLIPDVTFLDLIMDTDTWYAYHWRMGMQMDLWTSLPIWQALQMRAHLDCPKSTICLQRICSAEYKKNIRQRFFTWDLEVPGESRFGLLWKNAPDLMDLVWNCKYTYRLGHFLVWRKSITLTKFSVDLMIIQRLIEVIIVTSLVLRRLCWELSIPLSLVMTNISDDLSKPSLRKKVLFFYPQSQLPLQPNLWAPWGGIYGKETCLSSAHIV